MKLLETPLYQLYLLQLENYEVGRFLKAVFHSYFPPKGKLKKQLIWTMKMRAVFVFSVLCHILFIGIIGFLLPQFVLIIHTFFLFLFFVLGFFFYPLWAVLAVCVLAPFDSLVRYWIIAHACSRLQSFSHLKVIAITGSYGKTTMKEVLYQTLFAFYGDKVVKTEENFNTPLGVARTILKKLTKETEIFIVEMGAHYRGDIKDLCCMVPPDYAVVTGINESHLERFGSLENTTQTKFEIVEYSKKDAKVLLNADDERVMGSFKKYLGNHEVAFYSSGRNNNSLVRYAVKDSIFSSTGLTNVVVEMPNGDQSHFDLKIMAAYGPGLVSAALQIGEWFSVAVKDVRVGLLSVKPAPHRLAPQVLPNNILIIDDSYNGNPDGVKAAINVLRRYEHNRRVFVTPGLVEMGSRTRAVHFEIGRQLAGAADIVVLVKNSVTPFIAEGLKSVGYLEKKIRWLGSGVEGFLELRNILQSGDVVLLQNDWPENYF